MSAKLFFLLFLFIVPEFRNGNGWLKINGKEFTIYYTEPDRSSMSEYESLIRASYQDIERFFNQPIPKPFEIFIHPNRRSLDSSWQVQWNLPEFKSECWMVASGVGKQMDIISPRTWKHESCEHDYANTKATSQLITHELCHVFHGQVNKSQDFNDVENIDWFVEGLAVYASGQCDSFRMEAVKKDIQDRTFPHTLNKFWTGPDRYALSGSVVMFLDRKYGRAKLKELLPFNKKEDILTVLQIQEPALIAAWVEFVTAYTS